MTKIKEQNQAAKAHMTLKYVKLTFLEVVMDVFFDMSGIKMILRIATIDYSHC